VWVHTLLLLTGLPAGCPMALAWAALLHDVGKPATFAWRPTAYASTGTCDVGLCIAEEICRRLRLSQLRDGANPVADRPITCVLPTCANEGVYAESASSPAAL